MGPVGPQGAQGDPGPAGTGYLPSMSAYNTIPEDRIILDSNGNNIRFTQLTSTPNSSIAADISSGRFTIDSSGYYYLSYSIRSNQTRAANSRILVNQLEIPEFSNLNQSSQSRWQASGLIRLNAGDVVSLQLFGSIAGSVDLDGGQGASLTLIRVF